MLAEEFESRIVAWARGRPEIEALIQIGSRVDPQASVDAWSDWDFYLVASRPEVFLDGRCLEPIAPLWCAYAGRTPRGIAKLSAVFEGGLEADFVLLPAWRMKLVFWGLARPAWSRFMPAALRRGIMDTRDFLCASGTRVLKGGAVWEGRMAALAAAWPESVFSAGDFSRHVEAFWQKAVWISKRVARPEPRAAMHGLHALAVDHVYVLLAEEARLAGRPARAEARKAEQWLEERRLAQTAISTAVDPKVLARALLAQMGLFEEVSRSVAASHGFALPDHAAVAAWLRTELARILERA